MKDSPASVIFILLFLLLIALPFPGCMVEEERAVLALEKAGYSEVRVTERSNYFVAIRGGGKGDVVRFKCSAQNPAKQHVDDVLVFCGWPFKGTTIRTD